jgi:hypothetical protein
MMYWACYWYGRCTNAYRLLMGKRVAKIHMAGQNGEGRMMLRWVLDRACVCGKSVELLRVALEVALVLVLLSLNYWLHLPVYKMCSDSEI